jgi:hypothetical protein
LARLSAGEYVVKTSSVRKYGKSFFDLLNAGALPRAVVNLKQYASGGMVTESGAAGNAANFRGELTVGLAPGLVLDQMSSKDGERLILKVINQNRRGIRSALGL